MQNLRLFCVFCAILREINTLSYSYIVEFKSHRATHNLPLTTHKNKTFTFKKILPKFRKQFFTASQNV